MTYAIYAFIEPDGTLVCDSCASDSAVYGGPWEMSPDAGLQAACAGCGRLTDAIDLNPLTADTEAVRTAA